MIGWRSQRPTTSMRSGGACLMVYKDVCLKGLPDEGLDNCLSLKERATLVRNYVGLDKRSRLDVTLVLRS